MNQKQVDEWIASKVGRRLSCGEGLYLSRNGVRGDRFSWTMMWSEGGKRREAGLGQYSDEMKLKEARWASIAPEQMRRDGKDVIAEMRAEKKAAEARGKTFGDVAEMYVRDVGSRTWKTEQQRKEFERVVQTYCKSLGPMLITDVGVGDVKKVLQPWVKSRPTMVKAVASVIRRVIDTAVAHEYRPLGVNPASEDVLGKVLVVRHETTHFASMTWQKVPKFYELLKSPQGKTIVIGGVDVTDWRSNALMVKAALQLLILTALRKSEVTGLLWSEVDLETCTLTIGKERMKGARDHIVPLSRGKHANCCASYAGIEVRRGW